MKFIEGERVILLGKSCGNTKGLRGMLVDPNDPDVPTPKFGIVNGYDHDHSLYGKIYMVEVDDYDEDVHIYRNYVFKVYELERITDWLEDDLFTI